MQRAKTEDRDGLMMIETNFELENTKQRLLEAADALRRLTMNGIKPSGLRSQWPDVIHRVERGHLRFAEFEVAVDLLHVVQVF